MQRTLFEDDPVFTNRNVKSVTFQGKLELPIHRWYRLTPSFSPKLALDIADYFDLGPDDLVLDPFSGVGTVPLCMKYRGIRACSIEINPYLFFVSTVKTRTYRELSSIDRCFTSLLSAFGAARAAITSDARSYLREHSASIPTIHQPTRWWSAGNLAQLVCLRETLQAFDVELLYKDLLKMGALAILVPVSNAKHNHVSLTFAEAQAPILDLYELLKTKLAEMSEDLRAVTHLPCAEARIFEGNSKQASTVLPRGMQVTAVITSPPYPNRFSYARETRPHLFFFDFIKSARAVGDLEANAIGGTWGKATSVLASGVKPANELIRSLLAPYIRRINGSGPLMAYYVTKYFNDICSHAAEVAKVCRTGARLAYVIGNSKFYDHQLPSDELLAQIFVEFGFTLERIDRMRKRQSKKGLYEAVVFMRRS